MLRRPSLAAVAATLLFQSVTAAADPVKPIGKWVVDYRIDQCLASREYGSPDNPVTFGIRPAPNGDSYLLLLAQKRGGPASGEEHKGRIDFGSGAISAWLLEYHDKDSKLDIYQMRISAAQMDQSRNASDMQLLPHDSPVMDLQLESMPALLDSLEQCTADLKRYWNWDGDKDGRIATRAKGNLLPIFSSRDYPEEALSRGQQGKSQYLLLIDETGKVAGCDVIVASGVPALDVMGCQVIRTRAKFKPARDRNGNAVRSSYVSPPISWRVGY